MISHLRRHIITLLCLLFLTTETAAYQYEYELSRGRMTWQGSNHAIHYLDHFTFLTDEIAGIKGLMTSNFSLNTNRQFSLTFRLRQSNRMVNDKEGFMMVLSPDNVNLMLKDDDYARRSNFLQAAVSLKAS